MSRQKAINEMCKECNYDNLAPGSWRKQISECNSPDCPLYPFRALDSAHKAEKRLINMSKMTPSELEAHNRKAEEFKARLNGV